MTAFALRQTTVRSHAATPWGGNDDLTIQYGSSPETRSLINQVYSSGANGSLSISNYTDVNDKSAVDERALEDQLFSALAEIKVYASQVAMKMGQDWRNSLFRQLDSLLDPEEWVEGDLPPTKASFATYLKAMFLIKPARRPGLGISHNGDLVGAWTTNDARLTMTFQAAGKVRVVLSRKLDDSTERAALETEVMRLKDVLSPYKTEEWFSNGN